MEIVGTYIKVNGVWKPQSNLSVKKEGAWKPSEKIYFKKDGVWITKSTNIKMVLKGSSASSVTVNSTTSDYVINWGDGTTTNSNRTGSKTYNHAYANSNLYTVEISGNVKNITFCRGSASHLVEYLTIGNSNVKGLSFEGYSYLKSVGADIFKNDTTRTSFQDCFSGCESLQMIPEGLFDNCLLANSFYDCFYNCTSLTYIPELTFAKYPASVNLSSLFYNCAALTSATLKVEQIDGDMFGYCSSLKFLQLNNTTVVPLASLSAFLGIGSSFKVRVPSNLVDSYKLATNWNGMRTSIESI